MCVYISISIWVPGLATPNMHQWHINYFPLKLLRGFLGDSDIKESVYNLGDLGLIPELGWSPGEGNGYPLQYSCLGNPMDRGSWQVTVHGIKKNQTRLSDKHFHFQSYLRKRQCKRDIGPSLCLLESKKGALPASGGRRSSLSPETGNSRLRSLFNFFFFWGGCGKTVLCGMWDLSLQTKD